MVKPPPMPTPLQKRYSSDRINGVSNETKVNPSAATTIPIGRMYRSIPYLPVNRITKPTRKDDTPEPSEYGKVRRPTSLGECPCLYVERDVVQKRV